MLSAIVDIIELNILVQQQLQRLCLTSEESQLRAEFQLQGSDCMGRIFAKRFMK